MFSVPNILTPFLQGTCSYTENNEIHIHILSLNVQGLRDRFKRSRLKEFFNTQDHQAFSLKNKTNKTRTRLLKVKLHAFRRPDIYLSHRNGYFQVHYTELHKSLPKADQWELWKIQIKHESIECSKLKSKQRTNILIILENKLKLLNEMPNSKSIDQYVEIENREQEITKM